jgi:hypothetical protein
VVRASDGAYAAVSQRMGCIEERQGEVEQLIQGRTPRRDSRDGVPGTGRDGPGVSRAFLFERLTLRAGRPPASRQSQEGGRRKAFGKSREKTAVPPSFLSCNCPLANAFLPPAFVRMLSCLQRLPYLRSALIEPRTSLPQTAYVRVRGSNGNCRTRNRRGRRTPHRRCC